MSEVGNEYCLWSKTFLFDLIKDGWIELLCINAFVYIWAPLLKSEEDNYLESPNKNAREHWKLQFGSTGF